MGPYILRRIVQIPLVVVVISMVIFSLMHVSPGDPIEIMLGVMATDQAVAALREEYHLDRPLPEQYLRWFTGAITGDLGQSIRTREEVSDMIRNRFPVSFALASAAMFVALAIALPVGVISAYKHNSSFDFGSMLFAMLGLAIPNFALALILIYIFAAELGWFPVVGVTEANLFEDPVQTVRAYALPAIALGAGQAAIFTRLLRSSVLDVLNQDYVRTAYAKGLTSRSVLVRHALKNGLIPLITVAGINFAYLVGSTITIEFIFAIPGLGSTLIQAVINRDFPVIQGFTLFVAVFFIFINLLADVVYTMLDPRIRYD